MASPVVWFRQLSGASLNLSHSDLVRYRCYKRTVGEHQCICRFACFSCDGRLHGTWYVCVCARARVDCSINYIDTVVNLAAEAQGVMISYPLSFRKKNVVRTSIFVLLICLLWMSSVHHI